MNVLNCSENRNPVDNTVGPLPNLSLQAEYEDCIEAIERGQREATFLSGKLVASVLELETIR